MGLVARHLGESGVDDPSCNMFVEFLPGALVAGLLGELYLENEKTKCSSSES